MTRALGAMMALTLACAGLAAAGDGKTDLDLLQGNWKYVSLKISDLKDPTAENLKGVTIEFKDDKMKIMESGKLLVLGKIKLNGTKEPRAFDLTHEEEGPDKGKTEFGIYKIEADTLTMCVNDIGKDRPTAFAIKPGTKIELAVLKKVK